ncbi:MAG: hypothetical protein ACRDT6_16630 [Micromonosporaceae bacterium]
MRQRWLEVAVLAVVLFAINGVARLIVWQAEIGNDEDQIFAGLMAAIAAALVCVAAGIRWSHLYPMSRLVVDVGVAVLAAALLAVLVGPYLGGSKPLVEGAGFAVRQFVFYGGVMAFGAAVGVLVTVTLGKDWKSRGWKHHEEQIRSRPKRVP